MQGKSPSINSCDILEIRINLTGEDISSIVSDLTSKMLTVRSKKFKLNLSLPKPVKDKEGKAQWDDRKKILFISAPIDSKRAFDEAFGPTEEEAKGEKYSVV
ncbi:MAG: hypothetical protein EZS28_027103 [Streblomastix strix]|uniref:PIH1D1/2/3 CS-like domain-containing protein n=1 Tax=Streblomastix strix TaxID=222440 RepID=A0A5J4V5J5_9EUKA|nr:MAG: hypothetical protein EZS28_027103 [Streblomastix strix]